MWWAVATRAILARAASLPGVRQLLEARWRTRDTTRRGHEAAARAERLIEQYRQQDQAGS